ncbi:MAG: hypothetical protein QM737_21340 [Ferruginibacter sp.]
MPNDTQAVWFSTEMLLQALKIEPTAATPEITGLRFYFGAYGDMPGFPKDPSQYGKLTLVVVQTGEESIPVETPEGEEKVYLDIIDDSEAEVEPAYPTSAEPVAAKSTFNEGQLYPPPFNRGLGL